MQILLTNDDGIYAPGLAAMERALSRLGDVSVVAPAVEQSGVGHSITFLSPLMAKEVFDGERRRGWAVEGSPADCVKLRCRRVLPEAGPAGERHQRRAEPGHQRAVFGHGGRGDRGGRVRHHERRRVARIR